MCSLFGLEVIKLHVLNAALLVRAVMKSDILTGTCNLQGQQHGAADVLARHGSTIQKTIVRNNAFEYRVVSFD